MPHRGENKRNSTLRCTKTGGIQPKLNVACFVQSCLTDADFVIFSNYCLIGTRPTALLFFSCLMPARFAAQRMCRRLPPGSCVSFQLRLDLRQHRAWPHMQRLADAVKGLQRRFAFPALNGAQMRPADPGETAHDLLRQPALLPQPLQHAANHFCIQHRPCSLHCFCFQCREKFCRL